MICCHLGVLFPFLVIDPLNLLSHYKDISEGRRGSLVHAQTLSSMVWFNAVFLGIQSCFEVGVGRKISLTNT